MDLKWIVNILSVRHNICDLSYKSADVKLVVKLHDNTFETIREKETNWKRSNTETQWQWMREDTCNRGDGGGDIPPKNCKVGPIRKYSICQSTTRNLFHVHYSVLWFSWDTSLKKREYVPMPRFSEYFKLSETWKWWFSFLHQSLLHGRTCSPFYDPLGEFFPLVYLYDQ